MLQEKVRKLQKGKQESEGESENEQLKAHLDKVIEVKLKYENIIKVLVDHSEVKPIIASILEQ